MDPNCAMCEHKMIDPDEVNWTRVMIAYRILSLNAMNTDNEDLKNKYHQWIFEVNGTVEFDLAARIVFHLTMANPAAQLEKLLLQR